ncbi:MAG: class I SAM-dependent methyltransferase [Bacteroidota bacterium]|jgi:SAM-dependent methyltransferase|nr:class I SAM-dependent methyltransferase [Bacteroidota bacterium]
MEQTQQQIIDYYNTFYADEGFRYYPPAFTATVLRALCAKAGIPPGARVLDVGCATGYYSALFASLGYQVTGIDISATGIQKARVQYPDIRFEVQDATALPYPPGSFDFVFALGVSVANTRDLGELHAWLAHLTGVLSPGGTLALLGGSTLSGAPSTQSDWFNHTWQEIRGFVPPWAKQVQGPWLTHFRLMRALPPLFSMHPITTQLLRVLPIHVQRRIVILFRNAQ